MSMWAQKARQRTLNELKLRELDYMAIREKSSEKKSDRRRFVPKIAPIAMNNLNSAAKGQDRE
jgi:hypothetical protein